jgi:hypothetical protein
MKTVAVSVFSTSKNDDREKVQIWMVFVGFEGR